MNFVGKKPLRRLLMAGIAPGVILLVPPPVAAQTAPQQSDTAPESSQEEAPAEIVVTGSRIARPEITAPTPITVINSQSIRNTGQGNIQDVLGELPSVGTPNLARTTGNFASNGNGIATLNLRNLGHSRTLVLIDGRRSVGIPGGSALDVNNIPTDLVDRIEVVTGGASAVYGSDAVAGVVNFVLKDHFSGLRIRAQNTVSDKGDSARHLISVTGGTDFAQDRGHLIANFEYDDDGGLWSRDRSFSAHDLTRSSYAEQGLFSVDGRYSATNGQTFTFGPGNNLKPYQGANIDGYDRNQVRYLAVPVRRLQGAALGNYELSKGLRVYVEGEYSRTRSTASLEPEAVDQSMLKNFDGTPFAGIPISNPFIPDQIRVAMTAAGVDVLEFRRRSNGIFDRNNRDERTYWRAVGGIKGDITADWHFDVSYEHSFSKELDSSQSAYGPGYGAALNAIRDSSGNIVCADAAARAAGCVPINIFGFGTASAAAGKFITTYTGPSNAALGLVNGAPIDATYRARQQQDDLSGTITGKLFALPGGPVTVAAGAEYRREKSVEVFDPYSNAGLNIANQLNNTVGKFNVKEVYAEIVVPIVKDLPFVKSLGVEGAFRHADYSTVGGVNSFKLGGSYAPVSDLRFRVMYAQATRAPNIAELFAAQSQTFFGGIDDPCDQGAGRGDAANSARPLPAACASIPGVAATVARNGSFTYTTAQLQNVDGLLGGNPHLRPETARTLTVGAVLTPRFAPNFSLTADYYHIRVKNEIGAIDPNLSVQQCLTSANPVFCSAVTRDANGFVKRVNAFALNTGTGTEAGIDVQANYTHGFAGDGKVTLSAFWNHLLTQQTVPFPGGPVQNEVGQSDAYPNGTRLGSGFRDRVNGSLTLAKGPVTVNYRLDYFSNLVTKLDSDTAEHLPAAFYHNVQLRASVGPNGRFELYTGVNNLFDKKPPIVSDGANISFPGTNTIASSYDVFGRMLYAGIDVRF